MLAVVAVAALLLLALSADASVAPAVRHARRGAASSSPLSRARGPAVDMRAQGVNATWFSVCVSSSPSAPVVPPLPSPIAEPIIDAKVAATPLAIKNGKDDGCVAWGFHNDDIETLGWSVQLLQYEYGLCGKQTDTHPVPSVPCWFIFVGPTCMLSRTLRSPTFCNPAQRACSKDTCASCASTKRSSCSILGPPHHVMSKHSPGLVVASVPWLMRVCVCFSCSL